jgi:L-threonylcarbamoyladenylate synthase
MTGQTLPEAVRILEKDGVIIYPTETCYGLGADATSTKAIKKVYKVKRRDPGKQLSVIVDSLKMIKQYAVVNKHAQELVEKYMPGPLTLIVKNKKFPKVLCGDRIGFRIPSHPVSLALVQAFGKPITATSANLSGEPNPYTVPDLPVDFVINYGELPRRAPSTVYDTIDKKVIRQGDMEILLK